MQAQQGSFYKTGRTVYLILELIAWGLVVLGVIIALAGFSTGGMVGMLSRDPPFLSRLVAMLPGLGASVAGLFLVAQVQSGRATLHSADYNREMLQIMRSQASEPARSVPGPSAPSTAHRARSGTIERREPTPPDHAETANRGAASRRTEDTAEPRGRSPEASESGEVRLTGMVTHKGQRIRYSAANSIFVVEEKRFSSMDEAKAYIDKTLPAA